MKCCVYSKSAAAVVVVGSSAETFLCHEERRTAGIKSELQSHRLKMTSLRSPALASDTLITLAAFTALTRV